MTPRVDRTRLGSDAPALHAFITSDVPMGVPIEWNLMVVHGGFALFWAHPDVSVLDLGSAPLGGRSLAYRIHGAATGQLEAGEIEVAPLRKLQPWAAA